jgi:hypothetical protein
MSRAFSRLGYFVINFRRSLIFSQLLSPGEREEGEGSRGEGSVLNEAMK